MDLYLLRHAIAAEAGIGNLTADSERPLTEEGKKRMVRIARAMRKLGLSFDLILSSPYLRARETADVVAVEFGLENALELTPYLEPGQKLERIVSLVRTRSKDSPAILLVGHEPALSALIAVLLGGDTSIGITMKKAGLCRLRVDSLRYGKCATLEWLLAPRHLLRIK